MEPALVLKTAAALLGLAALGGMALAGIRLAGRPYPPAALAMGHGLAAGAALTLLVYAAFTVGLPTLALVAVGVLALAAAVGVWLNLGFHAQLKALPLGPMVLHALIAVAGFTILLLVLLQGV